MRNLLVALVVVCTASAQPLSAAIMELEHVIEERNLGINNFQSELHFPKFDPSLGELLRADLDLIQPISASIIARERDDRRRTREARVFGWYFASQNGFSSGPFPPMNSPRRYDFKQTISIPPKTAPPITPFMGSKTFREQRSLIRTNLVGNGDASLFIKYELGLEFDPDRPFVSNDVEFRRSTVATITYTFEAVPEPITFLTIAAAIVFFPIRCRQPSST